MKLVRCTLQPRQMRAGGPHDHSEHEFHLIVAGHGVFRFDGADRIACAPGSAWYTPPGMRHHIDNASGRPLLQYIALVRLDSTTATMLAAAWPSCTPVACGTTDETWFWGIQERFIRGGEHARRAAEHRFASWLHDILDRRTAPAATPPPTVERIRATLMASPHRAPSLAAIARAAGISPAHAVRLCREHLGAPPVSWHRRWRLETASRWLAASDLPIQEIGAMAGFADPFHFSRAFRTFARMSPSAWRTMHQRVV